MGDTADKRISDKLVSLVDIVFGVVFGLSIPAAFGDASMFTLPTEWSEIFTPPNAALAVAYVAIVLSWVGYHRVMEQNPFKIGSGGTRRFFIDLIIVFLYVILIYSRADMSQYLAIFAIIFVFYFIWDMVLNIEYQAHITSEWISFKYFLVFSAIWLTYIYMRPSESYAWISLALVFILNFGFRYEKGTWHQPKQLPTTLST